MPLTAQFPVSCAGSEDFSSSPHLAVAEHQPAIKSPAAPVGLPQRETIRWAMCFAVVLIFHVAGALALISVPEPSDYGVEGPVVTLDLPESLATTLAPPTDLAPGPKEEESVATPVPKEETKPPETEAEVAIPEPPKPEPPREERQATAPTASKATPKSITRWQSILAAHIERFKRYPVEARALGTQGVATVVFTMDRDGHVLTSQIVQSSGSAALDQESLQMLTRAQPMPKPPNDLQGAELSFAVPVRFNIK